MESNAALSQAFYLIRIVSPLVAGAVVASLGARATFILDAASFFFSAAMIFTLIIHRPPREGVDKTLRGLSKDFVDGNRFIFTHPGLSFVFIAMAVAMFVMSAFSPLISIFIRDQLNPAHFLVNMLHSDLRARELLYGLISSSVGFGLIFGTSLITKIAGKRPSPKVVLIGLLGSGIATAVLGGSYYGWEAALSMFLLGFAISMVLIPAQTMSQQETPPEMIGRVSSTFMSMISVAQVFGLLLSGVLAVKLGMRPLFFSCAGLFALITAGGWVYLSKRPEAHQPAA